MTAPERDGCDDSEEPSDEGLGKALDSRQVVAQAQGIMMERDGVSAADAGWALAQRWAQPSVGAAASDTGSDGDRMAEERDASAAAREYAAAARDRRAELRDARAERLAQVSPWSDAEAGSDRSASRSDRREASADRTHAREDREAASEDRLAAARARRSYLIDELTGAYRRDAGDLELKREISVASRTGRPFVVAFLDIDGLKATNDSAGHAAGDELLRQVVAAIRRHLRSYDVIARYGGDEFVCGLLGVGLDEAAERFKNIDADLAATRGAAITTGLAELTSGEVLEDLVKRADDALYRIRSTRPPDSLDHEPRSSPDNESPSRPTSGRDMARPSWTGDKVAFERLFREHADAVHGIVVRTTGPTIAADVTQDVFVQLWQHPDRYDPTRGSVRTFLVTVARNLAIDRMRAEDSRRAREDKVHHRTRLSPVPVDQHLMASDAASQVAAAVRRLPDDVRDALQTAFWGDMTYKEAATILRIPEGTVKSRIRAGLRLLSVDLKELAPAFDGELAASSRGEDSQIR